MTKPVPPPGGFGPPPPVPVGAEATKSAPPAPRSQRRFPATAPNAAALPLVTRRDELAAADGARARVVGAYVEVDVRMAPRPPARFDGHVVIRLADGTTVSLLPVWDPDARRPEAEVAVFKDHSVEVIGTVHAIAPSEPSGGASPTNPAVTDVQALRAAQ